jgi:hypothetical protein
VPLVASIHIKKLEDHPQHQFSAAQDAFTMPHTNIEACAVENHPSPTSILKPLQVFSVPPTTWFTIGYFMLAILSISPLVSGF